MLSTQQDSMNTTLVIRSSQTIDYRQLLLDTSTKSEDIERQRPQRHLLTTLETKTTFMNKGIFVLSFNTN